MSGIFDRVAGGVSSATGWSRDFAGDLLGAAGAGVITYFGAKWVLPGLPDIIHTAICSVVVAMVWKRNRRDNL
ncbi:MAG: hypothetical protein AAGK93_00135 [Pseudomonadota bacterium]